MIHLLLIVIYLSFISLGLPDGLLGSAWPSMYGELEVPVSYAGIVSMIIAAGTIISSLFSERLVKRFGAGVVTATSVAMTACALWGFSISGEFWHLCLWSIPYGLGAGSVDAALNNFVALHYESRHMSWLHCFWGVGCSTGPYVMSYFLINGHSWNAGYFSIFILQIILTVILVFSLPLWKQKSSMKCEMEELDNTEVLGMKKTMAIKGVKEVMMTFLCYCAIEQTAGLWSVSYVVFEKGISPEQAAKLGSVFFLGITIGRFLSGFLTEKFSDSGMVKIGEAVIVCGIIAVVLPWGIFGTVLGLSLIGLGCAPIYPCLIHATPYRFGVNASQAVIGMQMASAYVGTTFMPPLFGLIAENISVSLFPIYLIIILIIMIGFSEKLNKIT